MEKPVLLCIVWTLILNLSFAKPLNSTGLTDCFVPPKSFPVKCTLVDADDWKCVQNNIISVPQTLKNSGFSINCTATFPIDVDIHGVQLNDSYATHFVRNAENIYNEATFVYSIGIFCGSLTAPRRFTIQRIRETDEPMSFYVMRPGSSLFPHNLLQSPQNPSRLTIDRLSNPLIVPCVVNDPEIKPKLLQETDEKVMVDISEGINYDFTRGFVLNRSDATKSTMDLYNCVYDDQSEKVVIQVLPAKDYIAEPSHNDLLFFSGDEIRVSCKHRNTIALHGTFKNEPLNPRSVQTKVLPTDDEFKYASVFVEKDVVEGDSGSISCVNVVNEKDSSSNIILHTWKFKTVDVTKNPILNLTQVNNITMACQSSIATPIISAVFCKGVSNCRLHDKCLQKYGKSSQCPNVKKGYPCMHDNAASCLNFTDDPFFSQGMIVCTAGNYTHKTKYIRGFDGVLYPNWELAPLNALIELKLPTGKLFPQKSYPFGCRASKFISDGRLQWVIRGKDGSEILLHKGRLKELNGTFNLDKNLYTVRESNIRLIYPNDYDVLCLVPQWNATGNIRNFKRIHVEEKPTKVMEISIGAGVAIVLLIIPLVYVIWRLKIAKDALRNLTEEEVNEFLKGNPEVLKSLQGKDAHELVDSLPYNQNIEIPRDKLLIDMENVLGSGAFGTVLKGKLEGVEDCVAVKTVNTKCEIDHFKGFLSELKIMMYIGSHPNIVTLIGACTEKIRQKTLFIVVELCTFGSMESFLRSRSKHFVNQVVNDTIKLDPNSPHYENFDNPTIAPYKNDILKTTDLVVWAYQIANGMSHLASKKVVHADLAARNILLHSNGTAKITDFGLSRQLFDYGMYVKKQQEPLPWRWMAIESLQRMNFSTQSDVWAYGVTLWEMFSLGDIPYPGMAWTVNFVEELLKGLRMNKPTYATNSIYSTMCDCWKENATERPTFDSLAEYFRNLILELGLNFEEPKIVAHGFVVDSPVGQYTNLDDSNRRTNIYL